MCRKQELSRRAPDSVDCQDIYWPLGLCGQLSQSRFRKDLAEKDPSISRETCLVFFPYRSWALVGSTHCWTAR